MWTNLVVLYKITDEFKEPLARVFIVRVLAVECQEICIGLIHCLKIVLEILGLLSGFWENRHNDMDDAVLWMELLRFGKVARVKRHLNCLDVANEFRGLQSEVVDVD